MRNIKLFKILVFVLIFAVGFSIGFVITKKLSLKTPPPKTETSEEIPNPDIKISENDRQVGIITPESGKFINILFLGMGGSDHEGGGLTDSITLANINYEKKALNLISIPRDLWYSGQKINAVYSKEGQKTTKFTIGQITGMNVDYYLAVNFENFVSGIDKLGGIDVEVPKSWDDYFYPVKGKEQDLCGFSQEKNAEINQKYQGFDLEKQFTCRYEHLHFDKGTVHMDGATALKYVRSRHSAEYGGDFNRGQKAQTALLAIGKKLLEKDINDPDAKAFQNLTPLVSSDITLVKIPHILKTLGNPSAYKTIRTYLTDQNVLTAATGPGGAYILIPKAGNGNFEEVRNLIKSAY